MRTLPAHLDAGAQGAETARVGDPSGPNELDKATAKSSSDEATRLRGTAELLDLADDLVAIGEVARWCSRSSKDSWLRIEGP